MEEIEELGRDLGEIFDKNDLTEVERETVFNLLKIYYREVRDYGISCEEAQEVAEKGVRMIELRERV